MAKIGYGYGSEWHLLRYLGYHRRALDSAVKNLMGDVAQIEWLDFMFDPKREFYYAEVKGVQFLQEGELARERWRDFWPESGNVQNWDAVARLTINSSDRVWMLVEAKGHVGEIESSCAAKDGHSIEMIRSALDETKAHCGVGSGPDWTKAYYQHANRLAVLHHLVKNGAEARLLNIYFLGDKHPNNPGVRCPKTREEWQEPLKIRNECLGLGGLSDFEKRVYSLFLPVCGENVG